MSDTTAKPTADQASGEGGAEKTPSGGKGGGKGKASGEGGAEKRQPFHVVGPGSVQVRGKAWPAGSDLVLTEEEAESLGDAVAEGKAPPPPEEIAKRKAGRYKVAGPGMVLFEGRPREKGYVMHLDENDARSLGEAVTPAD